MWTCGPVATARVALENPARAVVSTRQRNAAEPRAAPLGVALKVCRVTFKMTAWKRKDRGLHMVCLTCYLVFLVWAGRGRALYHSVFGNNTTALNYANSSASEPASQTQTYCTPFKRHELFISEDEVLPNNCKKYSGWTVGLMEQLFQYVEPGNFFRQERARFQADGAADVGVRVLH